MSNAALQYLAVLTAVTSFAVSFVALARAPLRSTLGARAVYWLWLSVPASVLALALPRNAQPNGAAAAFAPGVFDWLWGRVDVLLASVHFSGPLSGAACIVWAVGACAALALMIRGQRSFDRSLGTLIPSADGTWRSPAVVEPMLIGALRPRVLVPPDFEQRYSAEEREFVLAHERAHMRRGDTLVNAFGAAWLCVFWFNPLMFWAMRLLRFDQDLACDAAVLCAAGKGRRGRYAEALLKAHLAGDAALPLPLACHWGSVHPLRRRIAELRRPVAGRMRHGIGILCVATLVASVSLTSSAVQPSLHAGLHVARSTPPASATRAVSSRPAQASATVCPLSRHRAPAPHTPQRRA
ncbi:MAG TPA: M56 family metallopeptidase [Steroidobacteraceae bacterium]|nr:M56 family metallopeptidase [Steroidobacteraceae bacterium]